MAHGTPDWWGTEPAATTYKVSDVGELAARLGSPNTYDRRGNVVWMTNFDHGLQGVTIGVDHGDSVGSLSTETALNGPVSLKLDPRGAANAYVNWRRVSYPLNVGKVGAEFGFCIEEAPASIYFRLQYFNGTNRYPGKVIYYPDSGDWKILNDQGNEVTILAAEKIQTGGDSWHHVKIVIDTENLEYHRLLIDDHTPDVSAYDLQEVGSADLGVIGVKVEVAGSVAANAAGFLDCVIITRDEP